MLEFNNPIDTDNLLDGILPQEVPAVESTETITPAGKNAEIITLTLDQIAADTAAIELNPIVPNSHEELVPVEPQVTPVSDEGNLPDETEQPVVTEEPTSYSFEDYVPEIANYLLKKGLIEHIPEDIDDKEFTMESYEKTLEYDRKQLSQNKFNEGAEAMRSSIIDRLDPLSQKIVNYNLENPNASKEEIISLTNELAASDYLLALDVDKDAETIVREYYRDANWNATDINTKVDNLINSDSLKQEAQIVKPRLDDRAREMAISKDQQSQAMKQFETKRHNTLKTNVIAQLQTGKLNGVPISKETAEYLYAAVLNEDQIVPLGNSKVQMGYAEAVMRQERHQGNIENVMLSLLVLKEGAEGMKKYYAQQAKNEEVRQHVKDVKFSSSRNKTSAGSPKINKLSTGLSFNM